MAKLTVMPTSPRAGPFQQLIDDYLQEKRAAGGSVKTARIYADALDDVLLPFLASAGVTDLGQLTDRQLNDLSVGLQDGSGSRSGRPLSKATVSSYMRAINSFLAWAGKHGEAVTAKAKLPKPRKRVLDTLSRDEIQRMEDCATNERDKLIVRVLADTGIRLGELLGLTPDDIRFQNRKHSIKVHGKGDRERLVPITPGLAQRLDRYAKRTRKDAPSGRLFLTHKRRHGSGEYEPLTESGAEQMINLLAETAGITKRVYPHLFRHSFITWQLQRNTNPILLARMVGHASLAMITQNYEHTTYDDQHDALMRSLLGDGRDR